MIGIIGSLGIIGMGLLAKYASQDGFSGVQKYWKRIMILGCLALLVDVYKLLR